MSLFCICWLHRNANIFVKKKSIWKTVLSRLLGSFLPELSEMFSQLCTLYISLWMVNFFFHLTPFASYLSYFYLCGPTTLVTRMTSREQFSPIVQYEAIEYWEKRIYAFFICGGTPYSTVCKCGIFISYKQ